MCGAADFVERSFKIDYYLVIFLYGSFLHLDDIHVLVKLSVF